MGFTRFLFMFVTVAMLTVFALVSATPTAGQFATPASTPSVACAPEPRLTQDKLRELAARPAVKEAPGPTVYVGGEPPAGAPADLDTAAAVEAVVRQYFACRDAHDWAAAYAVQTDDTIRAELIDPWRGMGIDLTTASYPFLDQTWDGPKRPLDAANRVRILSVTTLPDGLVGALIDDPDQLPPKKNGKPRPGDGPVFFLFTREDGRLKMVNTYGGLALGSRRPNGHDDATPVASPAAAS